MIQKLYQLFVDKDCTQVEINPMAESAEHEGKYLNKLQLSNTS